MSCAQKAGLEDIFLEAFRGWTDHYLFLQLSLQLSSCFSTVERAKSHDSHSCLILRWSAGQVDL